MRKVSFVLLVCVFICAAAYRFGDARLEEAKIIAMEQIYQEVSELMFPQIYMYTSEKEKLVYYDVEEMILPVLSGFRSTSAATTVVSEEEEMGQEEVTESVDVINSEVVEIDVQETVILENTTDTMTNLSSAEKKVTINRMKLQDFDYLRQTFYQVDNTTTIGKDLLDVNKLLEKDMTIDTETEGPKILIYHTHSQEGYADSVGGDSATSVVALGAYLETLLEENYGIEVLHHTGQYDVLKRESAYANALSDIEQILEENPTIEVVIDLHRDGVSETTHLVTDINGKPTAQIMFFNGLSRTTSQGELEYLENPYIEDNLAFSFQLQLAATEYYPGLTRKIYLKGYRYNMHLKPKSLLVEVGAQTNTFAEAKNAMEPLAEILAMVLK